MSIGNNRINVVKANTLHPDTQVMCVTERTHLYTLEQALTSVLAEGLKAPFFTILFHKSGDSVEGVPDKLVLF